MTTTQTDIGHALRDWRAEHRFGRAAATRALNDLLAELVPGGGVRITKASLTNWERGKRQPEPAMRALLERIIQPHERQP